MSFVPDWVPNIHPILVHFPIALLLLAPAFEIGMSLLKKRHETVQVVNVLYLLAGLSVVLVFATGKIAADSVNIPSNAYTTLSIHANLALYTLIIAVINGVLRGWLLFHRSEKFTGTWFGILAGIMTVLVMVPTADKGAKLVFGHGVGVLVEQIDNNIEANSQNDHENQYDELNQAVRDPLVWSASMLEVRDIKSSFDWFLADPDELNTSLVQDTVGLVLSLHYEEQESIFLLNPTLGDVEVQATLNRDQFKGVVRIIHHFSSVLNYDFLEVNDSKIEQGRLTDGKVNIFDSDDRGLTGWGNIKVVSSKGHFRGYLNQELLTHGHGSDSQSGRFGVYIEGSGVLKLSELRGTLLE